MQCAYCFSLVPEEATVCASCGRDLYLIRKLREEFAEYQASTSSQNDVESLNGRIANLEAELAAYRAAEAKQKRSFGHIARLFLFHWLIPIVLLCAAHALVVYVYEWSELYLHVLAILIPFPFAFSHFRKRNPPLLPWLIVSLTLAGCSVFLMSAFTAVVDSIAVFPQSPVEWRDLIAFFSSIASSHIAGMVAGRLWFMASNRLKARTHEKKFKQAMGQLMTNGLNPKSLSELASSLEEFATRLGALGAAAVSIYAGLRSFF